MHPCHWLMGAHGCAMHIPRIPHDVVSNWHWVNDNIMASKQKRVWSRKSTDTLYLLFGRSSIGRRRDAVWLQSRWEEYNHPEETPLYCLCQGRESNMQSFIINVKTCPGQANVSVRQVKYVCQKCKRSSVVKLVHLFTELPNKQSAERIHHLTLF